MSIKAIVFDAYGTLYDTQSVDAVANAAFPGQGAYITQIWRLKQLEYSWLRSMMGEYQDFWQITKDALAYTLGTLGLAADAALLERIATAYNQLTPYPDVAAALAALAGYRLAILSNGSPAMLQALTEHSGLARHFDAVLSVDAKAVFKPDPRAYALVEERLGLPPAEVLFVSSNGFDISGAKRFGFKVARIERVTADALRPRLHAAGPIGAPALFQALRTQPEMLGFAADFTIGGVADIVALVAGLG